MKKFLLRLAVIVAVLLPFMDTPNKKANRLIIREDFEDRVGAMVLSRPLPFDTVTLNTGE